MKHTNCLLKKIKQTGNKKLFCAFLTLGYPNLKTTEKLIFDFEKAGVDIVELGIPFSDPLADGPTIQASSEAALDKGVRFKDAFKIARGLRKKKSALPLIFFSYLNPIYHFGIRRFVKEAVSAGFDGVIIPDLPPEEEPELKRECGRRGLPVIYLVAPTTKQKRAAMIAKNSKGFVYYVSLRGVTGARKSVAGDIRSHLSQIRKKSGKKFLIGFGISQPGQVRKLKAAADGVIVGSAIVDRLRKSNGRPAPVVKYVSNMIKALKS